MAAMRGTHRRSESQNVNQRAQLATAYQELGKELVSERIRVIGNYTLGKVIGEGTYGKVRLGTHRLTQTRVAIKQIPKAHSPQLTREIHHHRRLHHRHVTQLFEIIATESSVWLVTELCAGGELFDYLVEKGGRLEEVEARRIVGELCLALDYVHREGAVHRDLKLENVLLDERCTVKLGDFGFTREYEKSKLLDTFCGTTGYAAPEMLAGKRYTGSEVDIWSLGIIMYCLLVGTLPFDDDDEDVMRDKIIQGDFEIPDWLNLDAGDLISHILQKEPNKRYTIPQILAHPWFTSPSSEDLTIKLPVVDEAPTPVEPEVPTPDPQTPARLSPPQDIPLVPQKRNPPSRASTLGLSPSKSISGSDTTVYHSAASDISAGSGASVSDDTKSDSRGLTTPTTSDGGPLGAAQQQDDDYPTPMNARKPSFDEAQSVGKLHCTETRARQHYARRTFEAVPETEEDGQNEEVLLPRTSTSSVGMKRTESGGTGEESKLRAGPRHPSHPPTSFPSRTPARTKRRSMSSTISPPISPTSPTFGPGAEPPVDYLAELSLPTPVLFSTQLENELLENMSSLGLDASQIVHSVLSDACDSTGALWWMIKRKAERKERSRVRKESMMSIPLELPKLKENKSKEKFKEKPRKPTLLSEPQPLPPSVTEEGLGLDLEPPPVPPKPTLAFVPPTPTSSAMSVPVKTPPPTSPKTGYAQLSLSNSSLTRSLSPEAGSSARSTNHTWTERQTRASTALTAGVLVKKKSDENTRARADAAGKPKPEEVTRQAKSKSDETARLVKAKSDERMAPEDPTAVRLTQAAAKLTKLQPSEIAPSERSSTTPTSVIPSSPWVVTSNSGVAAGVIKPTDTPEECPEDTLSSLPRISTSTKPRQRASLLTAFRTWFQDDKKKRKDQASPQYVAATRRTISTPTSAGSARGRARPVRTDSYTSSKRRREHRMSISSKHSSSANSRRSSVVSMNYPIAEGTSPVTRQRSDPRSMSPTSERGGEFSSRPSSVRSMSVSMTPTSPVTPATVPSPCRVGSSTKVVRQVKQHSQRHNRSNSAASSIRSVPNSRPTSFHEGLGTIDSDIVLTSYSNSPEPQRRTFGQTSFVAQKKKGIVYSSMARSTWKKSWGIEPPGWSGPSSSMSKPTGSARESDPPSAGLRDVFTGRPSLSPDDDDDWTDDDEFLGGADQGQGSPALKRMELPGSSQGGLRVNTQKRPTRLSPLQNNLGLPPAVSQPPTTEVISEVAPATLAGRRGNLQAGRQGLRGSAIEEEEEEEEE
ncbi:Pkinase protein [Rhizoctonia solani]|uniref:Pkinase protein n=1 Tax=Rhizoctonia solani TaxID=456999 RepID=A0A8H7IFB9_9AGAM|nr:Pkinase protein [Rhizoctonia solani]